MDNANKARPPLTPFEQLVKKIARVPKADVDALDAAEREERARRPKPQIRGPK
jgi:hypothetical protein